MANSIPSRLGQVNQSGDERALFLKVYAGEVLAAFERRNIMLPLTSVRTISHGKSASFPVVGRIGAQYHTPGAEIVGQKVNHNEVVISIDDLLISDAFIADIDEAMNHYDVRSIYSTEQGRKLATVMDENIMRNLIKAARSSSNIGDTDYPGGTEIASDKFQLGAGGSESVEEMAKALASALFEAAKVLDENDIDSENRYAVFSPAEYYILAQNLDLINSLYRGAGSISEGSILRVAGIEIKKSNNVPRTEVTEGPHAVDASKTVGLVWTPPAVGTVKLMDLSLQSEWDIRRQGTLMVARYAVGHGPLRPECAIELKLDTLTNA